MNAGRDGWSRSPRPLAVVKWALLAGAAVGVTWGGVEASVHFGEVEQAIKAHDKWAIVAFPITEGLAWLSTPFMLGAAARLGTRKIAFRDVPARMRELEHVPAFQWSMNANMLGAAGTTAGLVIGGLSLPGSAQPLAYGVAAGSLAISSIPIKVAYLIDRRRLSREQAAAS